MFFKRRVYHLGIFVLLFAFFVGKTIAKVPAGTIIGNAATATYYDENNNQYTTTSNVVQTVVQAVCGVDVYPDEVVQKEGVPGQEVYFPFQVKNTGNSKNTFSLTTQNGTYSKEIYLDENQNGVIDPGEQVVNSLTLGMDEVASIIVVVSIPSTAQAGDTDTFSIQAGATDVGTCSDTGNGEVVVLNDAVILFNKTVDKSTASPGEIITYTLSFKNTGTKDALAKDGFNVDIDNDGTVNTDVEGILIKDPIPADTTYVSGSASGSPTTNPDGFVVYSEDGVNWFKDETKVSEEVRFVGFFMPDENPENNTNEPVLSPDQQGNFTFKVKVNDPYQGDGSVNNKATIEYTTTGGTEKTEETNETTTTIPPSAQADIAVGPLNSPEEDDGENWKDDNLLNNVPAGSWAVFTHTVQNNGNVDDIVNLKIDDANTNLPEGAIVEFWNGDMSAKLIDTDADGNVDLGVIPKGSSKNFVVKVLIPANTPPQDNDGNVDYYVTVEGISNKNPTETDKSRDNIDGVVGASVDIGKWNTVGDTQNDPSDGNTDGTNDSDDILPSDNGQELKVVIDVEKCSQTVKNMVNPGEKATYPIEILNRGAYSDSFALSAKGYVGTVKFYIDENCDGQLDKEITSTPLLAGTVLNQDVTSGATTIVVDDVANLTAGDIIYVDNERKEVASVDVENKTVTLKTPLASDHPAGTFVSESAYVVMEVSVPENENPGEHNIVIEAKSENSNASDTMDAYLKVNAVNQVTITPDGSDQLPPGGTTTYQHIITNKGNAPVNIKISLPTDTKLTYIILDNDQNPQGTEFVLPESLNPGDTYTVYVKAIAPSDIPPGTVETVQVKVVDKDNDLIVYDIAEDTTTVIEGFIQLTKSVDKTEVLPGDTVTYTIKYKNIGDRKALNVVITDNIPNYTQYVPGSMCIDTNCDGTCDQTLTDEAGDDTAEYDVQNNLVRFRVGTDANAETGGIIEPGEEGCVLFQVQIQE